MMNAASPAPSLAIEDSIELLELQPASMIGGAQKSIVGDYFERINIPEVCKFTYCEVCRRLRPPRCEHCTNCNACILRVDHHCFCVGNLCIGFNN